MHVAIGEGDFEQIGDPSQVDEAERDRDRARARDFARTASQLTVVGLLVNPNNPNTDPTVRELREVSLIFGNTGGAHEPACQKSIVR
jgi:hypothetical protein